jgi:hypothetical protein
MPRKSKDHMTTEQLAKKALRDIKTMDRDEKAHVRAKLNREFAPTSNLRQRLVQQMSLH